MSVFWPQEFMTVQDLLRDEHVMDEICAADKKSLMWEIARHAAEVSGLGREEIFERLLQREKLANTGSGDGIAIPHVRSDQLSDVTGLFFRLSTPVEYEAMDEEPVDLVFLLLTPEQSGADHLRALSRISRLLKDQDLCARIRNCARRQDIYTLLAGPQTVDINIQPKSRAAA